MKRTNGIFKYMLSLISVILLSVACGILSVSCSFQAAAVNNVTEQKSDASYNNETLTAEDDSAIRQFVTDACEDFVSFLRIDIDTDCDYSKYVDNDRLNEYLKKRTKYFMTRTSGGPPKTTYEFTEVSINPDHAIVKVKLTVYDFGASNSFSGIGESQFCIEKHNGKLVITDWYITDDETENEFRPGYKIEKNIGFWN